MMNPRGAYLPGEPRVELNLPRSSCVLKPTKLVVVDVGLHSRQDDVIRCVEHVGTKLESHPHGDREVLAEREVQVPTAVTANGAPTKIAWTSGGARRRDNGDGLEGSSVQEPKCFVIVLK